MKEQMVWIGVAYYDEQGTWLGAYQQNVPREVLRKATRAEIDLRLEDVEEKQA